MEVYYFQKYKAFKPGATLNVPEDALPGTPSWLTRHQIVDPQTEHKEDKGTNKHVQVHTWWLSLYMRMYLGVHMRTRKWEIGPCNAVSCHFRED